MRARRGSRRELRRLKRGKEQKGWVVHAPQEGEEEKGVAATEEGERAEGVGGSYATGVGGGEGMPRLRRGKW